MISDSGGAFRKSFIEKLKKLNVKHKHSSAYHPQSNSLAERAVGSLKNSLKKSPERMSKLFLKEIVFEINSTVSQEMTGSANDRFLNRIIKSLLPNSINPNLNPKESIKKISYRGYYTLRILSFVSTIFVNLLFCSEIW